MASEHRRAPYLSWKEFMKNQERLQQNWSREGNRGVAREGSALLQGIVHCGVCGRKMSVQNRAARANRSPSYICGRAYQDGDERICQSMTSRPVDAAVVEAFLAAVSPLSLQVATAVLGQVEQDLVAQRRQLRHAAGTSPVRCPSGATAIRLRRSGEPSRSIRAGAAVERKAGACRATGADVCPGRARGPSGA